MLRRLAVCAALPAVLLGTTTACSSSGGAPAGTVSVVTSTNVYSAIAQALAGRLSGHRIRITSIITSASVDPHEYEAKVRDQLALRDADLVVENGGGYDDFMTSLRNAAGSDATLIDAVRVSGFPTGPDLNEHLWFDLPTVERVARRIAGFLIAHDPRDSAKLRANERRFMTGLQVLRALAARTKAAHGGTPVAVTEPLPGYLLAACGLVDVTPRAFSVAVEEGTGVAVRLLQQTLELFSSRRVAALVYNAQTETRESDAVIAAARSARIPTVAVSETVPDGRTYLGWLRAVLIRIGSAVAR